MKLFNKPQEESQPVATANKEAISSIIDRNMKIVGDISFKGKARIDGNIEGGINGEYLILSETGEVKGDIIADVLVCQGKINGNIKTKKLNAQKTSIINGSIETIDLAVESGASLSGEMKVSSQKTSGSSSSRSVGASQQSKKTKKKGAS